MKEFTQYSLYLFCYLLLTFGCHKHTPPTTQKPPSKITGFPISSYPFAVGDKWTYQVTDEYYGGVDTLVFTVTAQSILGNDTLYKTQTLYRGMVHDSTTVVKNANSFSYFPAVPFNSLFDSLWLIFPISDTPIYGGLILSDTPFTVGANISMNILGNDYTDLIQVKQKILDSPYVSLNLVTISPNIGIVREDLYVNYSYAGLRAK